ncbi:hypothetical protein QVD17_19379 [Tagetes erecta]|uniref:Uncharacterized protein n=1 Tax=Tagetes erecta TaxID=13708 RepID=A0AAD8NWW7_TARER|nr:hypothetical protein QVD17_19379 [Tagetes erecta]
MKHDSVSFITSGIRAFFPLIVGYGSEDSSNQFQKEFENEIHETIGDDVLEIQDVDIKRKIGDHEIIKMVCFITGISVSVLHYEKQFKWLDTGWTNDNCQLQFISKIEFQNLQNCIASQRIEIDCIHMLVDRVEIKINRNQQDDYSCSGWLKLKCGDTAYDNQHVDHLGSELMGTFVKDNMPANFMNEEKNLYESQVLCGQLVTSPQEIDQWLHRFWRCILQRNNLISQCVAGQKVLQDTLQALKVSSNAKYGLQFGFDSFD